MSLYVVMPEPYQTVLDDNGNPVPGALIFPSVAGTSTPLETWQDSAGAVLNTSPIVADSAGRFVAFIPLATAYKFTFKTAASVLIRTVDGVVAQGLVSRGAFAKLTSDFSSASASYVDVTGVTATLVTQGNTIFVTYTGPISLSAGVAHFVFSVDGVDGNGAGATALATQHMVSISAALGLSPGSHTIKLRTLNTGGTTTMGGSSLANGTMLITDMTA